MLKDTELRILGLNVPDGTKGEYRDLAHLTTEYPNGSKRDWVRVQGRRNRIWMLDPD